MRFLPPGPRYSPKKVALILLSSTTLLLLLFSSVYLPLRYVQSVHESSPRYQIKKVAVTQLGGEQLPLPIFAELLEVSSDCPQQYAHFDEEEAVKRLHEREIFRKLSVKKRRPDTLLIAYALYQPAFILGDRKNTYVSEKGHLMPAFPYFSPKALPTLYLGAESLEKNLPFVEELATLLGEVKSIDISQLSAKSKARREVVVVVGKGRSNHCLRLSPLQIKEQIARYFLLASHLTKEKEVDLTIDLRTVETAYVMTGDIYETK